MTNEKKILFMNLNLERNKIQLITLKYFNKNIRRNRIYNFTSELVYIETGNNNTSNYIP